MTAFPPEARRDLIKRRQEALEAQQRHLEEMAHINRGDWYEEDSDGDAD
jgi:hypothetical protein